MGTHDRDRAQALVVPRLALLLAVIAISSTLGRHHHKWTKSTSNQIRSFEPNVLRPVSNVPFKEHCGQVCQGPREAVECPEVGHKKQIRIGPDRIRSGTA